MERYNIKFTDQSLQDMDAIYTYIRRSLLEPATASNLLDRIETAVFSLEQLPYRCPIRTRGIYANQGYRQLFVENYTIVFRIDEERKHVVTVAVRYSHSRF